MTYLSWHYRILADPDVYFGMDREIWHHISWLVDIEKKATMVWDEGEWKMKHDNVNHPKHYTAGGIECIEAIEAALTPEEFRGYIKGNAIKYAWRERHKGGDESLRKAMWYLDRLLSKPSPTEAQDEANEREAWGRLAERCLRCGTPVKSVPDINGTLMNVLACECYEPTNPN